MARPKKPSKPQPITKEQFAKWSPEHQQAALNDRRIRQRIETAALPQEWKNKRAAAIRRKTPVTPGSSTTFGDLDKQRAYMETLTFGAGDRQLSDRASNLSTARQGDTDWFKQYQAQVSAAQDRAIQAQSDAAAGNQALINSANDVSRSSRDAIVAQLRDRAAQLGQNDQSAQYQQLADQAAASRGALMGITGQRQIFDANAAVNQKTAEVTAAGLKELEQKAYRDRQESALSKDKADYTDKKGAWREKFINDAISEARKQVLENLAYNQKATAAKIAADQRAQQLRIQQQNANTSRASQQATANHYKWQENKPSSSNSSKSDPAKRRRQAQANFNAGVAWLLSKKGQYNADYIVRASLKGGQPHGVSGMSDLLIAQSKGAVSRKLANRIVWAYIANRGRIPSGYKVSQAPKSWEAAYKQYRGK